MEGQMQKDMKSYRHLKPGQKGTRRLAAKYGESASRRMQEALKRPCAKLFVKRWDVPPASCNGQDS
jgi:hypothetical protein